jgi:hypothetical protein
MYRLTSAVSKTIFTILLFALISMLVHTKYNSAVVITNHYYSFCIVQRRKCFAYSQSA